MFTGIIRDIGTVRRITRNGESLELTIDAAVADRLEIGDSVAVDGTCLTVVDVDPDRGKFSVDVMAETFDRTALASLSPGAEVNLEPSLRLEDSIDGHLVTGHVDGVGTVEDVTREENARVIAIQPPAGTEPFIAPKGSIAVDGVSLTVVAADPVFTVSITDFTWEHTVFRNTTVGNQVNVEVDLIARYVARLASNPPDDVGTMPTDLMPGGRQARDDDASHDPETNADESADDAGSLLETLRHQQASRDRSGGDLDQR